MDVLSFEEIATWEKFEDLAAAYFRALKDPQTLPAIRDVEVRPSGKGPDGGRDVLVSLDLNDGFCSFTRKWVVQCKFYNESVKKADLSDVNIPTLIHEYGADGYLLICKTQPTSGVSEMIENLALNCRFRYSYFSWHGEEFLMKIRAVPSVIDHFFPKHARFLETKRKAL